MIRRTTIEGRPCYAADMGNGLVEYLFDDGERMMAVAEPESPDAEKVTKGFDPDQPRDENGRWAYHGAPDAALGGIEREGLKPAEHDRADPTYRYPRPTTFFTDRQELAEELYGGGEGGGRVFRFPWPADAAFDYEQDGGKEYTTSTPVPPERLEVFEGGNWRPLRAQKVTKGDVAGHPFRGNQYVDGEGGAMVRRPGPPRVEMPAGAHGMSEGKLHEHPALVPATHLLTGFSHVVLGPGGHELPGGTDPMTQTAEEERENSPTFSGRSQRVVSQVGVDTPDYAAEARAKLPGNVKAPDVPAVALPASHLAQHAPVWTGDEGATLAGSAPGRPSRAHHGMLSVLADFGPTSDADLFNEGMSLDTLHTAVRYGWARKLTPDQAKRMGARDWDVATYYDLTDTGHKVLGRRKAAAAEAEFTKGDYEGHPFRGNQWGPGEGEAANDPMGTRAVTHTPEFKEWFEGSTMVDDNGKPLVLFHGTPADIDTFRPFAHFGTKEAANARTENLREFEVDVKHKESPPYNVMPVYVSASRLVRIPDLVSLEMGPHGIDKKPTEEELADLTEEESEERRRLEEDTGELYGMSWEHEGDMGLVLYERGLITQDEFYEHGQGSSEEALAILQRKGYHGVVYENAIEDAGKDSYVIFDPRRVKSAIGNKEFSKKPSIVRVAGGPRDLTAEVGRIFKGDFVGHPFRGNQYTDGELGSMPFADVYSRSRAGDKEAKAEVERRLEASRKEGDRRLATEEFEPTDSIPSGSQRGDPAVRYKYLWHLTDRPDFKIDPERKPALAYGLRESTGKPGLFLTQDPFYWIPWMDGRKDLYAVRVKPSGPLTGWRDHPQFLDEDPAHAEVLETLPIREALKKYPKDFRGGSTLDWSYYIDADEKEHARPGFEDDYRRYREIVDRHKASVPEFTRGDYEGHPFRGNQWTEGDEQGELFATGEQGEMFPVPGKPKPPPEPEPEPEPDEDEEEEPEEEPEPEEDEEEESEPIAYDELHDEVPDKFFHGTTEDYLGSILREGLTVRASRSRRNFDYSDGLYEGERGESIYLTPDQDQAAAYSGQAGYRNRGVVLQVKLPPDVARELLVNEKAGGDAAYLPRDVRPEWIETAYGLDDSGQWAEIDLDAVKAKAKADRKAASSREGWVTLYMVVTLPKAEEPEAEKVAKGDLPGHPFRGNQYTDGEGGGAGPYMTKRDEFVGPYPSTGDWEDAEHVAHRAREKAWDRSMDHALSMGEITLKEARARGYHPDGHIDDEYGKGIEPLPDTLYHVTTAASKVMAEGLKTREELNDRSGNGLGGGADNTVSFTDSPETAKQIHRAMLEMRSVARGDITIDDMIERARSGSDAKKPYLDEVVKQIGGGPDYLDQLRRGVKVEHDIHVEGAAPEPHLGPGEWRTIGEPMWVNKEGKKVYAWRERDMTPKEKDAARVSVYKTMAFWREQAGGPLDPLFFTSDTKALGETDPGEIQILTVHPKKKGKSAGYRVSALGEWRTFTGDAVEIEPLHGHAKAAVAIPEVTKGDFEGHPFRGNQYTDGVGGGVIGPAGSEAALEAALTPPEPPEPPEPPKTPTEAPPALGPDADNSFEAEIGRVQEMEQRLRDKSEQADAYANAPRDVATLSPQQVQDMGEDEQRRTLGLTEKDLHKIKVRFFHGTTNEYLDSIMRKGLDPKNGHRVTESPDNAYLYEGQSGESVFLTRRKDVAQMFGSLVAKKHGGRPVVLTVEVPLHEFNEAMRVDPEFPPSGQAFEHLGKIPAKWIKKIDVIAPRWHPDAWSQVLAAAAQSVVTFYVALVVKADGDEDDQEKVAKGDFPGHPFRGNQWTEGSPEFKEWFGQSKITDAEGKPAVLYHVTGANVNFAQFKAGERKRDKEGKEYFTSGPGIWLAADPEKTHAAHHTYDRAKGQDKPKLRMMPLYVRAENPLILTHTERTASETGERRKELEARGLPTSSVVMLESEVNAARAAGYDSVISKDEKGGIIEVVVFHPNQVKSALGNSGKFSRQDNHIGRVQTPEFFRGDLPGHPFRGNQWTEGEGGGGAETATEVEREREVDEALGSDDAPSRRALSTNNWGNFREVDHPVLRDILLRVKAAQERYEREGGIPGVRVDNDMLIRRPRVDETDAQMAIGQNAPEDSRIGNFVLEHGTDFPLPESSPPILLGKPKMCYANAGQFVLADPERYDYAEGYVVMPGHLDQPVHHGWAIDKKTGTVVDPTLGWVPSARYIGVRLTAVQLATHIAKRQRWGVTMDGFKPSAMVLKNKGYIGAPEPAKKPRAKRKPKGASRAEA